MKNEKVYRKLASAICAYKNCLEADIKSDWEEKWLDIIEDIQNNYLPSGSGIDSDNKIDIDKSDKNKIIINCSYHLMNSDGYYMRWIDYEVKITRNLLFLNVKIIGRFGKDQPSKDYLEEMYNNSLISIYKDK